MRIKKRTLFLSILSLLIIFRLCLPYIVKNYVNKVLKTIPGYYGEVADIDISLYRGAYTIKGAFLNKTTAQTQVPFLNFPKTDISIEWKSVLKGRIVSEILMKSPEVIYVLEDMDSEDASTEEDWTKALTDLAPIDLNHLEIKKGKLAFVQANAQPTIDIQLNNLYMTIDNLRNVTAQKVALPSTITSSATSIGNGEFVLNGKMNIIKEIPDMDIAFSLEDANVTALNDFTNHYARIDFEKGKLGLFNEIVIADGYLKGYFKVLLKEPKYIGKGDKPAEKIWEGLVSFFNFLLKNQKTNTFAVKVPLEGDLSSVKSNTLSTVLSIFKNAFIKALKPNIDEEIEFKDVTKKRRETK